MSSRRTRAVSDDAAATGLDPAAAPRGVRELKKLPGSASARLDSAKPRKPTELRVPSAGRQPRQSREAANGDEEHSRLYLALGQDLLGSLPEAAAGYMQQALATAPKDSWLAAEAMGSLCVALNTLGRHEEALRMADAACELLRRADKPTVQLAVALHNLSLIHI